MRGQRVARLWWAQATTCTAHRYGTNAFPASPNPLGPPAFAFDIDGVLIRGKRVLEEAKRAMAKLCPGGRWQHPAVFLTNGGGVTERYKAEQLSAWLEVPVSEDQVVLSHSPMRDLVPRLGHHPVLVSGRGSVVDVAQSYGFQRVIDVHQLAAAAPHAVPFVHQGGNAHAAADASAARVGAAAATDPIRAVLVMTDPSNWYLDLQLILDVLQSHGHPLLAGVPEGSPPVELYFSNGDMLWANEHPRNRLGQGAFAHIILSLYRELTGTAPATVKFFGKPHAEPYRLAERLLVKQAVLLGLVPEPGRRDDESRRLPFSAVYAVGDNPAADVRGANRAGPPWVSVLVQTGVFQGPGNNCTRDTAHISVAHVDAAVDAAMHRTRSLRFHSMR